MGRLAVAAAAAVVFLALVVLVVPRLVSLDSLSPRIVAALEEKAGRKVELAGLSLSLFPGVGVRIRHLSVAGDPGHPGEKLFSVPEAEVRLAILPLFSGRAEFTTIVLKRPAILFRRYRDGTHSATEIANRLAKEEKKAPAAGEKVSVRLAAVRIEDASLFLRIEEQDGTETRWEIAPFFFSLSGIGRRRHDFALGTRLSGALRGEVAIKGSAVLEAGPVVDLAMFEVRATGKVFGQPVSIEGKMSAPAGGPAEVDVALNFFDLAMDEIPRVFAAAPPWLSQARPEGKAQVKARISGNLQSAGFELEVDLTRAGWTVGRGIKKYIDAPCTLLVEGHRFPGALVISNAEVRFPPLLAIGNAAWTPSSGAYEWSASARISSLAEFARSRGGEIARYAPSGRVTASGRGKRAKAAAPADWNAAVDLGDVGFQVPGGPYELRGLDGHVEADPRMVSFLPLAGLFNGQRFTLRGPVFLGPSPRGRLDIRMAYLDADALFPEASKKGGKKAGEERGAAGRDTPAGKDSAGAARFFARANVRVDAGKVRGFEFQDLAGVVAYEKGVLLLEDVRVRLLGGEATLAGRIGLGLPARDFHLKVAARNIAAAELLRRNTSLGDTLLGTAAIEGELGGVAADLARTAAGRGSVRVTGGKIKGVDLLATAASVAGLSGLIQGAAPAGGRALAGETAFSDFSAAFRVKGGRILAEGLRITSDRMALSGNAVIGFDKTLEFRGVVTLSGDLSKKAAGRAGEFLRGPGGRVEIPIVLSGPLTGPAAAIDAEALARGAVGGLMRGITEGLSGRRPGRAMEEAAPAGEEGAAQGKGETGKEERKGIEGLFDRLLPRR